MSLRSREKRAAQVGALFGMVAVATAVMCTAPTEIIVDVYTEAPCDSSPQIGFTGGTDLKSLEGLALTSVSSSCARGDVRSGRIVLRPSAAEDEPVAFSVVTRVDGQSLELCTSELGYDKCIIARRQLRFSPQASTTVEVHLRTDCVSRPCLEDQTCVAGACVSAALPMSCLGATCTEGTLIQEATADGGVLVEAGVGEASVGRDGGPTTGSDASADAPGDAPTDVKLDVPVTANFGQHIVTGANVFGVTANQTYVYWSETRPTAPFFRVVRAQHEDLSPTLITQTIAEPAERARGLTLLTGGTVNGRLAVATGKTCYSIYNPPAGAGLATDESTHSSQDCFDPIGVGSRNFGDTYVTDSIVSGLLLNLTSFVSCPAPQAGYIEGAYMWSENHPTMGPGVYYAFFPLPTQGECPDYTPERLLDTSELLPALPYGVAAALDEGCATLHSTPGADEFIACGPRLGKATFIVNLGPNRQLEDVHIVDRPAEGKRWLYWGAVDGLWRTERPLP